MVKISYAYKQNKKKLERERETERKKVSFFSEFLSSAERKCYFEEQGKPNSCWFSVTSIFFLLSKSMWTSNCLLPRFTKISYFVFSTIKKFIQIWNNMRVSK